MNLCGIMCLSLFGVLLLVAGVVFPQIFPSIMASQLDQKLVLSADSPTIGNFISPPVPIFMQFYFFNVTNPADILKGATAKLNQVGPFTYEETRLKYDLLWEEHDATVTFKQNKTFFFRPDMSNGLTEDVMLTVPNPVLLALAAKVSGSEALSPGLLHGTLEMLRVRFDLRPFITRKAGELLYYGYQEHTFNFLAPLTGNPLHATGKFGFFYPKNNSNDGTYRVYTGASGLESIQVIDEFRGHPTLNYWKTESCNMVNGTEGAQFPRPITPETKMMMYSSDLCRSLYFKFEKKVMHGNLELYRYTLPYEVLAQTPENDCFCTDEFTCRDSMVNLSPCKDGSPIVASTPHFYMGTNETINAVEGLSPSKEEHETFLDIEPNTGVTFQAHKRIQISIPLLRYADLPDLANVKEVVLPILWLNESAIVQVEKANTLYTKLTLPILVVKYVCIALMVVGALLLVITLVLAVRMCRAPKKQSEEEKKSNGNLKKGSVPVTEYDRTDAYKHLFAKS